MSNHDRFIRVNSEKESTADCNYNSDDNNEDLRMQTLQEINFLCSIYDEYGTEIIPGYGDNNIDQGFGYGGQRDLKVEYEPEGEMDDSIRRVTSITAVICRKITTAVILKSAADRRAVLSAEEAIAREAYNLRNCSKEKQSNRRKININGAVKMIGNDNNVSRNMRPLRIPSSAEIVYHTKSFSSIVNNVGLSNSNSNTDYDKRLSSTSEIPIGYITDIPFLVEVRIVIPQQYPNAEITDFLVVDSVCGSCLTEEEKRELLNTMRTTSESLKGTGMGTLQSIIENAKNRLIEIKKEETEYAIDMARQRVDSGLDGLDSDRDVDDSSAMEAAAEALFQQHQLNPNRLGRRCIYFHHIWCTAKRRCIQSLARKLLLQGFCKIGYPGILIVEGSEDSCKVYVQVLQKLRWKMMVVRGEDSFLTLVECNGIDAYRKMPLIMGGLTIVQKRGDTHGSCQELRKELKSHNVGKHSSAVSEATILSEGCIWETNSAAEIAEWCRACDLYDLFKTSMKIYS